MNLITPTDIIFKKKFAALQQRDTGNQSAVPF
jgi:hypothetical protein